MASGSAGIAKTQPSALEAACPVVVLVAICTVAGLLLGAVHSLTAPIIAAVEQQRAEETYAELLPEAAGFEELACETEGCTAALRAVDSSGVPMGYVIVAQAKGYGGQVPVAVAFDAGGSVAAITVMANSETPGLGSKAAGAGYLGQYVGLAAEPVGASQIDLISGATISSRAVLTAFNTAVEAYGEVS